MSLQFCLQTEIKLRLCVQSILASPKCVDSENYLSIIVFAQYELLSIPAYGCGVVELLSLHTHARSHQAPLDNNRFVYYPRMLT